MKVLLTGLGIVFLICVGVCAILGGLVHMFATFFGIKDEKPFKEE